MRDEEFERIKAFHVNRIKGGLSMKTLEEAVERVRELSDDFKSHGFEIVCVVSKANGKLFDDTEVAVVQKMQMGSIFKFATTLKALGFDMEEKAGRHLGISKEQVDAAVARILEKDIER